MQEVQMAAVQAWQNNTRKDARYLLTVYSNLGLIFLILVISAIVCINIDNTVLIKVIAEFWIMLALVQGKSVFTTDNNRAMISVFSLYLRNTFC